MRTTLDLDDKLMKQVKRKADESGRTIAEVIEASLRESLRQTRKRGSNYRLNMVTVKGTKRPGVDLISRDFLFEAMERR